MAEVHCYGATEQRDTLLSRCQWMQDQLNQLNARRLEAETKARVSESDALQVKQRLTLFQRTAPGAVAARTDASVRPGSAHRVAMARAAAKAKLAELS